MQKQTALIDRDPTQKAFDQGCMWGMSGRDANRCPYEDESLMIFWEAGWEEGHEAWIRTHQQQRA